MNSRKSITYLVSCLIYFLYLSKHEIDACRVNSEKLKQYARKNIDGLLDASALESFYWRDEPIPFESFSKILGLDITSAVTRFSLDSRRNDSKINGTRVSMLRDISVTCSAKKDRSYTLTINLELKNPFDSIYFRFKPSEKIGNKEIGEFRVLLSQSTFVVQLNQRIRYDECFDVDYVQLETNVAYTLKCSSCDDIQKSNLDKLFHKKMALFDAQLDLVLSDKLLLGLQYLLSEQRLDLDLYLN